MQFVLLGQLTHGHEGLQRTLQLLLRTFLCLTERWDLRLLETLLKTTSLSLQ